MEVYLPQNGAVVHSIRDVELLDIREVMGTLRMGRVRALKLIKSLPSSAVLRSGRGNRFLVHAWALHHYLNMDVVCPGCGRPYPKDDK